MVSRKPRSGSLMVRETSLEELGRRKAEINPLQPIPNAAGPDLPLYPAYRFNTTTTAEPSGRISATVSKSFFSLATSPILWDPSGMNLLNAKTGSITDHPEGTVPSSSASIVSAAETKAAWGCVTIQLCGRPGRGLGQDSLHSCAAGPLPCPASRL